MSTSGRGRNRSHFFVYAFATGLLPFVVADGQRILPLLTIWVAGCAVRWHHGDRHLTTDCCILALVAARKRKEFLDFALQKFTHLQLSTSSKLLITSGVVVAVGLGLRAIQRPNSRETERRLKLPEDASEWTQSHPKAKIFPCATHHARIFPKRHAFQYSYLQCGFPIVPVATLPSGVDISDGRDRILGTSWMQIREDDYLERGYGELGFYMKLRHFLTKQHIQDADWSYAYLVTAPRFFGYSFNPVSFWYIYDRNHELKKMILEVNNTFGERRMYLLDGTSNTSSPRTSSPISTETSGPDLSPGSKSRFTDIWMKDFHVSPFNSRKGQYALKALNPFPTVSHEIPVIDNTVTLKSSKDHAKLVARLHSTGDAIDVDELGIFGTFRFILSWWWVGFATFPRIIKEAGKLFFQRNLHVWFRPEVLSPSIGRLPTETEVMLERVWRTYLFELVHEKDNAFCITLQTSMPTRPSDMIATTHIPDRNPTIYNLEMRILTPAFYSRLVHYMYTSEAIDRECVFTEEKNRTLWICRPQYLPLLLSERKSISTEGDEQPKIKRGFLDELRWSLLRILRCPPADQAYPVTPKSDSFKIDDIRSRSFSELDKFVRTFRGSVHACEYRRAVTKLFLAQRFAFGFPEAIGLVDFIIRASFCFLAVLQLTSSDVVHDLSTSGDWPRFLASGSAVASCHIYQMLKGYS